MIFLLRFQQHPHPSSRTLPKHDLIASSSSFSDLRMPYSAVSVTTTPNDKRREESSTIQSGVTYWSSQTDLAISGVSPPPEPTADFPKYHPPASLELSDLAIRYGDIGSPKGQRSPTAPSLSVYGPPASHFIPRRSTSRDNSPLRIDLIQKSRSVGTQNK